MTLSITLKQTLNQNEKLKTEELISKTLTIGKKLTESSRNRPKRQLIDNPRPTSAKLQIRDPPALA